MTTTELATLQPAELGHPLTAAQLKSRLAVIQSVMRDVMQNGVDFGVIPGTKKPTLGLAKQTRKLDGLRELCESAGWYWPFKGACLLTERPRALHRDEQGRLHATDRAALEYPDGWGIYAWHGVRVAEAVILRPDSLVANQIANEANAEVRRVMLERFGHDRFIHDLGVLPVHADETGTLYRVALADDEPLTMVHVVNSTPEAGERPGLIQAPDGTWRKRHWIRVPPDMQTARQAVAWTFALTASRYAPGQET